MSSDHRQDLRQAIQFVRQNLKDCQLEAPVAAYYDDWESRIEGEVERCPWLREPKDNEPPSGSGQHWRYRAFLEHELGRHIEAGRLSEESVASLRAENRRIGTLLKEQMESPVTAEAAAPTAAEPSSGNLLDTILDPRSLQYLMMLGASVLMVGLVIWLATQGFFDNPLTVAICGGIVNLAILGTGAWLLKGTKLELAGRGLCLLACLLMPLHLWFYDYQGLIVLNEGGHLWVPALVIVGLYGLCALLIRDRMFVYALIGGVTLTGLMILGDQSVGKFWQGAATSSLLIVIGALAIHAERAFPKGDGPFSQGEFGQAFFRAGHIVLMGGLLVMLSWNVCAWTYDGLLSKIYAETWRQPLPFDLPALATNTQLKLLAVSLMLVATYLYGYSYALVQRNLAWIAGAFVTLLWAEAIAVSFLPVSISEELVVAMFGLTGFIALLAGKFAEFSDTSNQEEASQSNPINQVGHFVIGVAGVAGILLSLNRMAGVGLMASTMAVSLGLLAVTLVARLTTSNRPMRQWYAVLGIAQAASAVVLVAFGLDLLIWQKLELLVMTVGAILLVTSHIGWARERDQREDWITVTMMFGSMFLVAPVLIGLVGQRLGYYDGDSVWRMVHDIGTLSIGLLLLGSGILLRLRATTITGATAMVLYLTTLVVYIRLPEQLQGVAVYMMIGGGAFFVVAIVLSIFRDYLLSLPKRYHDRKGLFRVLNWR
ncbi:hypothetical protein AB1L30_12875 [Bremerella sp. JC817]|uniref:hypothetical protein n=1 Tax=Bremerella sp. JC817 TaxID=3231756 RepID=UPI00345A3173